MSGCRWISTVLATTLLKCEGIVKINTILIILFFSSCVMRRTNRLVQVLTPRGITSSPASDAVTSLPAYPSYNMDTCSIFSFSGCHLCSSLPFAFTSVCIPLGDPYCWLNKVIVCYSKLAVCSFCTIGSTENSDKKP